MQAPSVSSVLVDAWGLSNIRLIADTHSSFVFRATQQELPVIVKTLKPEGRGERPGMDFLRWRDGLGAIKVLAQEDDTALLEDAGHLTLRTYHGQVGDVIATEIIVDVLQRLHAPSSTPFPAALTPLHAHFGALFSLEKAGAKASIADVIDWSASIARHMLAEQYVIKPLHGDLHHDNIIGGERGGWIAIDPQGLLGDPAYDVANVFGNPLYATDEILDPQRAIRLARRFATALDCTASKILRFAAAHAGLSAAWTLQGGLTPSGQINLDERLGFARMARSILAEQFVD
ncbi:streptomycin resistance protein [Rhizobium oryziradicis]|uniref:Streptomycin resistance protein n=1 Tax=Rhizobium oryziradicis TaxID=1867956 RepID=A0A1Q8ZMS0_9HYPH|nr:streptomycin resistance protein [Rhizobium oryziradicis]